MKNLLNYTILLVFCLIALRTTAQIRYVALEERIQSAPFIFEGKVIASESYWDKDKGMIYTSQKVQIQTVFKGDIVGDEVEIILEGGEAEGRGMLIMDDLRLETGNEGIFFCGRTSKPSHISPNSGLHLGVYASPQGFIRKSIEPNGAIFASDYFHIYTNTEVEIYRKIEQLTGLKRRKIGLNLEEQRLANWLKNQGVILSVADEDEFAIKYSIENATITGTSTQTLEFDIFAETEWIVSELFAEGGIILKYDTAVLGSSIALNGRITGSKEQIILSSDYGLSFSDEAADEVKILAQATNNPSNLFTLTQTSEKLCHISLEIINPLLLNLSTQITFDESAMQGLSLYYSAGFLYNFPYVIAEDSVMASFAITIDSISPLQLNAGVRDTLTIYGSNFGTIQGSGKVEFKNADDGGSTWIVAAQKDSVLWSDNVIKIRVPSKQGIGAAISGTAGTGQVRVTPALGSGGQSTQVLTIGYAWNNIRYSGSAGNYPNEAYPLYLNDHSPLDSAKGYVLHYNENFKANVAAKNCFEAALRAWRCATNVNISVAKDSTTNNTIKYDSMCVVKWLVASDSLPSTLLVRCVIHYESICYDEATFTYVHHYPILEIDFVIDPSVNWQYDTTGVLSGTQYDFYSAVLHEIGHGHGLGHVIEYGKLLHYTLANGQKIRQITPIQLLGAIRVLDSSIVTIFPTCNSYVLPPMVKLIADCNDVYSSVKDSSPFKNVSVYPNPFSQSFYISFETQDNEEVSLKVLNSIGQEIKVQNLKNIQGKYSQEIHLSNPSGIFFLVLQSQKGISTYKLIAQ